MFKKNEKIIRQKKNIMSCLNFFKLFSEKNKDENVIFCQRKFLRYPKKEDQKEFQPIQNKSEKEVKKTFFTKDVNRCEIVEPSSKDYEIIIKKELDNLLEFLKEFDD